MENRTTFKRHLKRDLIFIAISTVLAIVVSKSGLFEQLFELDVKSEYIAAFIAGIFFTSFFTTPFAIAMFLSLAPEMSIPLMILTGAAGGVFGDLFLFGLMRNTFADDVTYLLGKKRMHSRFMAVFHRRVFRWVIPFVGALIIASPLPDELGITLMGVSTMKVTTLMPISFAMNALGIAIIGFVA